MYIASSAVESMDVEVGKMCKVGVFRQPCANAKSGYCCLRGREVYGGFVIGES